MGRKVASRIQSRAQSREMLLDTNKEEASQPDQEQAVASDSSQDEDDDVTADIENSHYDKHSDDDVQQHEAETQQSPSPHHTPEEDKVDERFQEDGDEKMINARGDESEEDKKTLDADESTKED